jgi:hypothetical protein
MIAPHQSNERKPKFGDGPKIRRYKRRWKVELLFARPENRRRLVVRYDRRGRRTTSASRVSGASSSCCGIYEMVSGVDAGAKV